MICGLCGGCILVRQVISVRRYYIKPLLNDVAELSLICIRLYQEKKIPEDIRKQLDELSEQCNKQENRTDEG